MKTTQKPNKMEPIQSPNKMKATQKPNGRKTGHSHWTEKKRNQQHPFVNLYRPLPPKARHGRSRFERRTASPLFGQYPVQRFLCVNGITLETARSLELGWTYRRYLIPVYGQPCPPQPSQPLPSLVYPYRVEGRLVGLVYRSCRLSYVRDHEPLTYDSYDFSEDRYEVTGTPELPLPPYRIDCINPRWHPERIPLLLVSNDEIDVAVLTELGYTHAIALTCRSYAAIAAQLAPFRNWFDQVDCIVLCCDPGFVNLELASVLKHFFGRKVQYLELPDDCYDVTGIVQLHGTNYLSRRIEQACAEVEAEEAEEDIPDDFWPPLEADEANGNQANAEKAEKSQPGADEFFLW